MRNALRGHLPLLFGLLGFLSALVKLIPSAAEHPAIAYVAFALAVALGTRLAGRSFSNARPAPSKVFVGVTGSVLVMHLIQANSLTDQDPTEQFLSAAGYAASALFASTIVAPKIRTLRTYILVGAVALITALCEANAPDHLWLVALCMPQTLLGALFGYLLHIGFTVRLPNNKGASLASPERGSLLGNKVPLIRRLDIDNFVNSIGRIILPRWF